MTSLNAPKPHRTNTSRTNTTYLIEVGGVPIHVTRKAVRNINLRIHDDGSLHMSVPWRVSRATAEDFAQRNVEWIRDAREYVARRRRASERLWKTGDTMGVWGVPTPIRLEDCGDAPERASLIGQALVIQVHPEHMGDDETARRAREELVESFLRDEGTRALAEMLPACEARVGKKATSITFRRMKTRWGSCTTSKGTIRLNTGLVEHSRDCFQMVLIHELCHLWVPNHGEEFYRRLSAAFPAWREVRRELRAYEGNLRRR